MRLALILEYEGTNYHGFQFQANANTIQEELEKAIKKLTGRWARVSGAGRTDSGVHAAGQVVAFDTNSGHNTGTFFSGINYYLPNDIAVRSVYNVGDDFDPRRHAISRTYRYTILNRAGPSPLLRRNVYFIPTMLDVSAMQEAALIFEGEHDFVRFSKVGMKKNVGTRRVIFKSNVKKCKDIVTFEIEGNSFLHHQVRRMVGSLTAVGRGVINVGEIKNMINGRSRTVSRALPPQGLCLMRVDYTNFPPEVD